MAVRNLILHITPGKIVKANEELSKGFCSQHNFVNDEKGQLFLFVKQQIIEDK